MSAAIIRQLGIAGESILIIHDGFAGAKEISDRFSPDEINLNGLQVAYVKQRKDAFFFANRIKPREIFVDGDVGFKNFITLMLLKAFNDRLKISVFEEGIGTYRNDLYSGAKKRVFQIIGIGVHFGGSRLTSCVYVTSPSQYNSVFPEKAARTRLIKDGPKNIISMHKDAWISIFGYKPVKSPHSSECNIYISDWNLKAESLKNIFKWEGDYYVKLHPRCNDEVEIPDVIVLESSAPAEMILSDLSEKYTKVRVFHHGSSVTKYFDEPNVDFTMLTDSHKAP